MRHAAAPLEIRQRRSGTIERDALATAMLDGKTLIACSFLLHLLTLRAFEQ
jgi:hypothetical protein